MTRCAAQEGELIGGRHEWATTIYTFALSDDAAHWLRARIRAEHGLVVRFTIQYEAVIDDKTYPVIRYDSAHGSAHRDVLDWDGTVIAKDWIVGKSYSQVVTDAIADIKANWHAYHEAFLRRKR